MKKLVWHSSSEEEILEYLHTNRDGLTSEEVVKRLEKYGKNELPQKKRTSVLKILWEEIIALSYTQKKLQKKKKE